MTYFDTTLNMDSTIIYGTQCTSKRDLKDYEKFVMDEAADVNGSYLCTEQ